MSAITIRSIETIENLESLADDFAALAPDSPFLQTAWLVPWCSQYLRSPDEFFSFTAVEQQQVIGIAPFCLQHIPLRGRTIRFLGSGEVCSDYMTLPVDPQRAGQVTAALADTLLDCRKDWDRIELDGMSASDQVVSQFVSALASRGCRVIPREALNCWRLELAPTWDEYLQSLSGHRRKRIRRAFNRAKSGSITMHHAVDSVSLKTGLDHLRDLHQRRWTSLGEPGCFASDTFDNFLSEAARRLLDIDKLELSWLEGEGEPISADISLRTGAGLYGYQSGIAPEQMENQPGRLHNLMITRRCIEQEIPFIDYLRGDESYKKLLHADRVACVKYEIVAPKRSSIARQGVLDLGRQIKSVLPAIGSQA